MAGGPGSRVQLAPKFRNFENSSKLIFKLNVTCIMHAWYGTTSLSGRHLFLFVVVIAAPQPCQLTVL